MDILNICDVQTGMNLSFTLFPIGLCNKTDIHVQPSPFWIRINNSNTSLNQIITSKNKKLPDFATKCVF